MTIRRKIQRKIGSVARVVIAAVLTATLTGCEQPPPPGGYGQFESEWKFRRITTGETVSVKSMHGKVLFINIWATWCGPCVREMPSIESLYKGFAQNDKVEFLIVSEDEDLVAVENFAKENGYSLPIYFHMSPRPREFVARGIPMTFIVDANGNIRKRHEGSQDWDTPETISLLNELAREAR